MLVSPVKPLALGAALFLVWLATTGRLDLPFVLLGLLVCVVVVRLTWATFFAGAHDFSLRGRPWPRFRLLRLLRYPFFFLAELLSATWEVALLALRPTVDLHPAIVRFESVLHNRTALVLLANQVTLTPGTLTIDADVNDHSLFIHVLDLGQEGLDGVDRDVRTLEDEMRRVVR